MSHSRSHKKNPSPSSNRHADENIPSSSSKPDFGGKTWDTITKEEPSSPDHHVWLPEGEDLDKMSATVRRAVAEIVQPVYEELVAQAHSAMEKSLGLSLVHCLWLEILNQQGCKSVPAELELLLGNDNRQKTIDQFLKLTNAKIRISNILTRLQELRFKQQNTSAQPLNVQNPKFDDKNQLPDFPAQDQKVQKQESAHENHLPFSLPPYTFPFQQTSNMQNQKFDNQKSTAINPNLDSHISNLKFQIPQQSDAQNQPSLPLPPSASPHQKDPNLQNCKFDDKNQATEFSTQDQKPKAQDPNVQNCNFAHENQPPLPNP